MSNPTEAKADASTTSTTVEEPQSTPHGQPVTTTHNPYHPDTCLPKTLLHGSCQCRSITYTANIVLDPTKIMKCNCNNCVKHGKRSYLLHPSDFTLLTPSSGIDDDSVFLTYRWASKTIRQQSCRTCGVYLWGIGKRERWGGDVLMGLNVNTLDGVDWSEEKWRRGVYADGKGGFRQTPRDEPFEWGCW